jgi:polar amino acid transport system ATP-binding protein/sulfate transport system ATP-binding protein/NitT/TauT family transport system ATP-binding protein
MGVIFQSYYLFEWRTIEQSLMMAARQNPLLKGNEKAAIKSYAEDFSLTGTCINILNNYRAGKGSV